MTGESCGTHSTPAISMRRQKIFVAIRIVKSFVKMLFVGVIVLLVLAAWLGYSMGFFR